MFRPEERCVIRAEIQKLLDRGIIRPSVSPQRLCGRKKDGALRLSVDWRVRNMVLVPDSGGFGDKQTIFNGLKGKRYFTQVGLAVQHPFNRDRRKGALQNRVQRC